MIMHDDWVSQSLQLLILREYVQQKATWSIESWQRRRNNKAVRIQTAYRGGQGPARAHAPDAPGSI